MSSSSTALDALSGLWAVRAVGADRLHDADRLVRDRLAQSSGAGRTTCSESTSKEQENLLRIVALAYKLAARDSLRDSNMPSRTSTKLQDQVTAACHRVFDIHCALPVPTKIPERLFFALELSTIAYCADRVSDLHDWYEAHEEIITPPSETDTPWDRRLLYRIYRCWIRLFQKSEEGDLDRVLEIITGLRADPHRFEPEFVENCSPYDRRTTAMRLIALYHWAKVTEVLAIYMFKRQPADPFPILKQQFDSALNAVAYSGDLQFELILHWLPAAAHIMAHASTN